MNENKPYTDPDFADEAPDLSSPEWAEKLARATVRRGRPKALRTKVSMTLRLDSDVIEYFREGGRGWQTRVNETLRQAIAAKKRSVTA